MNRDPILFRVDASAGVGYERLTRCLTYASALQRRRRPTFFLSQLEPRSLGQAIKRTGSEWLEADAEAGSCADLEEAIQEIRRLRPAAVIIDAAGVTENYLTQLAATGVCLVSIDHLGAIRLPAQLVVNPLLGEAPGLLSGFVVTRTELRLRTLYGGATPVAA